MCYCLLVFTWQLLNYCSSSKNILSLKKRKKKKKKRRNCQGILEQTGEIPVILIYLYFFVIKRSLTFKELIVWLKSFSFGYLPYIFIGAL